MPRTPAHQKHQTRTRSGIRAHIRIHTVLHTKHFRTGTDPVLIRTWLLATEIRYRGKGPPMAGRFPDDATTYLAAVRAMPTYRERETHIEDWAAVFGNVLRATITSDQIRAQLHAWKAAGQAASTVNHKRTALMHLYSVLDGKSAANPVKDVPKFAEPSPFPRALSSAAIARLLSKMRGKEKARAMVLAYTGIPHAQIAKIEPGHVNLTAGTVIVTGRRKGQGTATSIRRLTGKGVQAFRLMGTMKAWGPVDRWTLRRAVHEACAAAQIVPPLRPYDLRHFFGTELYRRSGDIRAVQILMGHSTPTLTHRYTLGAVEPRVEAALRRWSR